MLAAGAAWVAILSRAVATESLETYPVLFPDSFDWLANALRYTGVPLDVTWRAVLTPFLQAALFAMHDEATLHTAILGSADHFREPVGLR